MRAASIQFILECSAGSVASITGLRHHDGVSEFIRWTWANREDIPDAEPNLTAVKVAWDAYDAATPAPVLSETQTYALDTMGFVLAFNGEFNGPQFAKAIRENYNHPRAEECAKSLEVPGIKIQRENGCTIYRSGKALTAA